MCPKRRFRGDQQPNHPNVCNKRKHINEDPLAQKDPSISSVQHRSLSQVLVCIILQTVFLFPPSPNSTYTDHHFLKEEIHPLTTIWRPPTPPSTHPHQSVHLQERVHHKQAAPWWGGLHHLTPSKPKTIEKNLHSILNGALIYAPPLVKCRAFIRE